MNFLVIQEMWRRLQERFEQMTALCERYTADSQFTALTRMLSEWDSPEDAEAFRDL